MVTPKLLNSRQQALISECPVAYRKTFVRAFTTNSKSAGIKGFCLACVGFLKNEVRGCTSYGCPLWPHRPYQDDRSVEKPTSI